MNPAVGNVGDPAAEGTYTKITRRLIPFLFLCYVFAFLDRINIGIAQLDMKQDVGFSDLTYSVGAGIFFLGYVLMEVPSNLLLARIGVKKTFSRIMILWGIVAASTAFVTLPSHLYAVRFLLGLAEAGLYPGVIFYLTRWYPVERRAKVIAIFTCATGIAGLFGGPMSGWLMTHFDGLHGLHGWQWMFIAQGLPASVLGVIAFFYLDDGPQQAKWLSDSEKAQVVRDLQRSSGVSATHAEHTFGRALLDPHVYVMGFVWFTQIAGVFAIGFWLPTLIKSSGVQSPLAIGGYSAIPYFVSWVALIALNRSSDRTMERRWHCAVAMLVGAGGLLAAGLIGGNLVLSLVALSIATAGILAPNPLIWAITTDYIRGRGAAGGVAIVNCVGLLGGFVSPMIIGSIKTLTNSMAGGLGAVSLLMVLGAIAAIVFAPRTSGAPGSLPEANGLGDRADDAAAANATL
ncbi:MFS transporter [Paraburkholderia caballeronis]|uniref:Sugar phosphate permease n=1 Tax=Paraburkholderia caballeronis TaxID=416943 RepID=A0A1H7NY62_9BURK|nr:MFS transporter [Paraburkholderia caballeronis]PXW25473.1 sugar phosphate permease [Paraburkholderia caballeronis]PXX01080.1 sugar phosphate permease [Paraburkholderia caballeronis]RAJ99567.1 sugar phosphate permease [Paraburkholderia caballeronis]TDV11454.1 sugar phosphate permease [Paraburkholderia caballeronis]TDV14644.1 sugar phosphate permease [Paraburkholderia caballeronis]